MILAIGYSIMCLGFIAYNTITTKKLFNALNIYLLIWALMVLLYNLKLILYYDLSTATWILIFISTMFVFWGYTIGVNWAKKRMQQNKHNYAVNCTLLSKKKLRKAILATSFIASLAIIPNTIVLLERYGLDILSHTTQIYIDNISGNAPWTIPYFGVIIYVSDILSGIYFSQYGYNKLILIPMILTMLCILPSGSRGWLILAIFFFVFPCFLFKKQMDVNIKQRRKRKNRLMLIFFVLLIGGLFILLTINRSQNLDPNDFQYMSPTMIEIAKRMPWIYKLYQYFASSVGVLNEFIKAPDYFFGKNTFAVIYNFLDKFGLNVNYSRYQTFYLIPISTNVGTWLLELIQDFGMIGMFIVITGFSFAVGYFERLSNLCPDRRNMLWATVLDTIFVMSFFVWYFREGTMIVIILTVVLMDMKAQKNTIPYYGKIIMTRQK